MVAEKIELEACMMPVSGRLQLGIFTALAMRVTVILETICGLNSQRRQTVSMVSDNLDLRCWSLSNAWPPET